MNRKSLFVPAMLAGLAFALPAAAGPQAFVASGGSDANTRFDCRVDKPCRTFAAALTVVASRGEIVAQDAADYGTVAIAKSVSLIGNGYAGISSGVAMAAVVIATPDVDVVLRGVNLLGPDALTGLEMTDGRSLSIENCVVSGFLTGVSVRAAAKVRIVGSVIRGNSTGVSIGTGASATVVGTQFIRNAGVGLIVLANSAGTAFASVTDSVASGGLAGFEAASGGSPAAIGRMTVTRSTASGNTRGFVVTASDGNAFLTVGASMATGNGTGFSLIPGIAGASTFESLGDNIVRQNGTDTAGPITPVAPM